MYILHEFSWYLVINYWYLVHWIGWRTNQLPWDVVTIPKKSVGEFLATRRSAGSVPVAPEKEIKNEV